MDNMNSLDAYNNSDNLSGSQWPTQQDGTLFCPHVYTYPQYYYWPYPVVQTQTVYVATEPTICTGKAHVFECDHVSTCKCGKIKRVMPRAKSK